LFDSGIGGLSVARHVMALLPHENIVYFGDTARVPYGSKSSQTVIGYTHQAVSLLESLDVKMIIVACNTASAVALEHAERIASVPVIGVIQPGAQWAVESTRSGVIGVIGTEGTIRSDAYAEAIRRHDSSLVVHSRSCPMLVGFAEEGLQQHPAAVLMTREYVHPLISRNIDTLIMGCTHYPILASTIAHVVGPGVVLVDPGVATAAEARRILERTQSLNPSRALSRHDYYLSDLPHKFVEVGERFLGRTLDHVHRVSLEELASQ